MRATSTDNPIKVGNMLQVEQIMQLAIEEARISLAAGNSGFGAVIVAAGRVISRAHDTDKTSGDPTAHAEMNAIRSAAAKTGGHLSDCILVSTHEPCPMCSTAILWSGISAVAFGYSIKEALKQGRRRVDIPLREIFERSGRDIVVHENVLRKQCSVLYDRAVRQNIDQLRGADEKRLELLACDLSAKRVAWFAENCRSFSDEKKDALDAGYRVFLAKLGIRKDQAPVVSRDRNRLVLHSTNYCPTLEACRILDLDTRFVCRYLTEKPTTELLRQVNPKLRFTRNYEKLRPYSDFCEEMILLEE